MKSKKISSWVIVLGCIVFVIPFFQILGLILLGIGTFVNYRTDRTEKQKAIWTLPLIVCFVLAFILTVLSKWVY